MFKHVLVAYDGSAPAEKAFAIGLELARTFHGRLRVVSVVRPPDIGDDVETPAILDSGREKFLELHRALQSRAERSDVPMVFDVLVGHPAALLLAQIEEHQIDHIVVGHKGKSVLQRWLVGSVSRQVVDYASVSVTVIR